MRPRRTPRYSRPHRLAVLFDIGNNLTATWMTRQAVSAALYPPIRVLLRQDEDKVVAFEYDRPVSIFGQFGNSGINEVATSLDRDLHSVLHSVASG